MSSAHASNIACSSAALNDPAVQAGSPPGCTQVDMQFSMIEPVVTQIIDNADQSSQPTDANVSYTSSGGAGGTGENSQLLQFSQLGGFPFFGNDIDNFITAEEWSYTFTIGVTDIGGGQISGFFLKIDNPILINTASIGNISENLCPGTTSFSDGCSGEVTLSDNQFGTFELDTPFGPTLSAGVQLTIDIDLNQPGDSFGLRDFQLGFDEITPEPATFALMAIALAAIAIYPRRRRRTN